MRGEQRRRRADRRARHGGVGHGRTNRGDPQRRIGWGGGNDHARDRTVTNHTATNHKATNHTATNHKATNHTPAPSDAGRAHCAAHHPSEDAPRGNIATHTGAMVQKRALEEWVNKSITAAV